MSFVTNVVAILREPYPERVIDHIGEFTWERRGGLALTAHLEKVPREIGGGTRVLECDVYLGAFNYLPVQEFIEHVERAPWNGVALSTVVIETEGTFRTIFRPSRELVEDCTEP